jgi:hypothetical protein
MDKVENTRGSDDHDDIIGVKHSVLADTLARRFGTPDWNALLEIGKNCALKAGIADLDLHLLARKLAEAISGMLVESGKLSPFPLQGAGWLFEPDAKEEVQAVLGSAYGLMEFLRDPPPFFQTAVADRLYHALEEFVCSLVPELTLDELCQQVDELRAREGAARKDRRLDDRRVLCCVLAECWKDITGCDPDPWKDPTSGRGRGVFWLFVTEASKQLNLKPPSINSVLDWVDEALPKLTEQRTR